MHAICYDHTEKEGRACVQYLDKTKESSIKATFLYSHEVVAHWEPSSILKDNSSSFLFPQTPTNSKQTLDFPSWKEKFHFNPMLSMLLAWTKQTEGAVYIETLAYLSFHPLLPTTGYSHLHNAQQ